MNHFNFTVTETDYSMFLNEHMGYQLEVGTLPQGLDIFKFQLLNNEAVMYVRDVTEIYCNTVIPKVMTSYDYEEIVKPFIEAACIYIHYSHKLQVDNLRMDNAQANAQKKMCYGYLYHKGFILS